jgi:hypothetical protein
MLLALLEQEGTDGLLGGLGIDKARTEEQVVKALREISGQG